MNELKIILVILVSSVGLLLYFVGWINTIFMALGKKQHIYASVIFILNPLAIYYCITNWKDGAVQGKQMIIGLVVFCVTAIPAYMYVKDLAV